MKQAESVRRNVVAHAFRALWACTASSNLADGMLGADRAFTTEALEAARSRPAETDTDTDTTGVLS